MASESIGRDVPGEPIDEKFPGEPVGRDFPERVFAMAAPAGAAALFAPGQLVTSATVGQFARTADDVAETADALAAAGFEVLQTTRLMVNIAGPAELYEQVFGVRLYTQERQVIKPGATPALATFIDCEGSAVSGLVDTAGSELADVVAGVGIEEPYYPATTPPPAATSPEPPEVDYWHLTLPDQLAAALRADSAHGDGVTGDGVRVAMVDTGFQQHPFFAARGYRVEPTVLGPGTADPEVDEHGHGTGEAANVFAAAPGATLSPVKSATASGALVNTTAAFNAAAALDPHIITNSWGSDLPEPPLSAADQALAAAVAGAVADGVVVVFSAGNGSWGFPGQHPDVIAAGGVYQGPDGALQASDYASGFDSAVYAGRRVPDVSGLVGLLPGAIYLMLPVPPGSILDRDLAGGVHPDGDQTAPDDGWAAFSGTSAAAPQLAGVCALVRQVAAGLAPDAVRAVLMETARDVTAGTNHPTFGHAAVDGPDLATGHGLVDAAAAVAAARSPGGGGGPDDDGGTAGDGPAGDGTAGDDDGQSGGQSDGDGRQSGGGSDDGGTSAGGAAGGGTRPVVAMVLLRPADGSSDPAPSVATLEGRMPAPETIADVAAALARAGFWTGPANGLTFAIEATPEVFQVQFGTAPTPAPDGGWTTEQGDELPLHSLPPEIEGAITAVVLERPAELHGER